MRLRWWVTMCMATTIAGCGAPPPPPVLMAAPREYLLGIDQLVEPDFSVDTAPRALSVDDIAAGGAAAAQLSSAGFRSAASEDFFRPVGSLALANGPVQVRDTVEEFASQLGAATVYGGDVARLDAQPGGTAVSTGALGASAHAVSRAATGPDAVTVVEITVEWRVDNLVDLIVIRGRDGATRPGDALILAHRQTTLELGLATPAPAGTSASPL